MEGDNKMSELALTMPSSYVGIGSEEMEYVDGGWCVSRTFYTSIGRRACLILATSYGTASLVLTFGAILTGITGIGLAAFGLCAAYTGYDYWKHGKYDLCLSGIGPFITGISEHTA